MTTLRETIQLEVKSMCKYFDWDADSEQANSVLNAMLAIADKAADMSKDLTLIQVLSMKKTAYVEKEPILEPLHVIDHNMQQIKSRTRPLQYVSVEDIKKIA